MFSSQLVGGHSMKDGTVVGGSTIQWVLGNNGSAPWPAATTLRLVAGPVLASPRVDVPSVAPGQTAVIELEVSTVQAPAEVSYVLVTSCGKAFGEILTIGVAPAEMKPAGTPFVAVLSSPRWPVQCVPSSTCLLEWMLANSGNVPWPADARARLVYSTCKQGQLPEEVALPAVAVGMTLHLEIGGCMPDVAGNFKALWAVESAEQPSFGELLLAEFEVMDPQSTSNAKAGPQCTGGPHYAVKVSNRYSALATEPEELQEELPTTDEDEKQRGHVMAMEPIVQHHAASRGTPAQCQPRHDPPTLKDSSHGSVATEHARPMSVQAARASTSAWPSASRRSHSPCYTAASLLFALLLGPHVCLGGSQQRGVVGTCGGRECIALLESSETSISVHGAVASIELVQTFRGSLEAGGPGMADASFVLPINEGALVTNFSADIGGQRLRGHIQERKQAQQTYDQHVQAGCAAALAQQGAAKEQRPQDARDLFRISIGNVPAGTVAQVNLSIVQELEVEDVVSSGTSLRLMVPTAAPSRYAPAGVAGAAQAEWALQASGRQLPNSFAIHVEVQGKVESIASPSHAGLASTQWSTGESAGAVMSLALVGSDVTEAACKADFVLRLALGLEGDATLVPHAVFEQHPEFRTWVAMVELVPRFTFEPEAAVELLFVVDRSGSMSSSNKMPAARRALQHFVRSSPVGALVNIVGFGSSYSALWAQGPQELREASFHEALQYAEQLLPNFGGTELHAPLAWLLGQPLLEGRARRVFVLTDGETWRQEEILHTVEEKCGAAEPACQLFALGVGRGVSTALVEGLARAGRGSARFVAEGEEGHLEDEVVQMLAAALQPAFSDVSVAWPSGQREVGVPLLSRRRLHALPSTSNDAHVGVTTGPPPVPKASARAPLLVPEANGLFDVSAEPPSAALRSRSVGAAAEEEERQHMRDLERFVAQGGVLDGPLQSPQPAPPILVGQRWAAYAFLGRLHDIPQSLVLRANRSGKPVEVRAHAVQSTKGRMLHALAARRLVGSLEGKGNVKGVLPGEEDRRWQVAALGLAYGIATAQTSWLALGERPEMPGEEERRTPESSIAQSLAVLDMTMLGSSVSLRRMSRITRSVSVLDFASLGSSLSLRSFARLGSSVSVLDFLSLGSSLAIRTFGRLGSSVSVFGAMRATSAGSALPEGSVAESASAVQGERGLGPATQPHAVPVAFVGLGLPGRSFLPLLPLWSGLEDETCMDVETNLSWWKLPAGGQLGTVAANGFVPRAGATTATETLSIAAEHVATGHRLGVNAACEVLVDETVVAHVSLAQVKDLHGTTLDEGTHTNSTGWDWVCPPLPAHAYERLISAQRFDGSFAWPEAFLLALGWVNATAEAVLPIGLPIVQMASGTAIAAMRRCFGGQRHKWSLLERKALAQLRILDPSPAVSGGEEAAVTLAEQSVLVRAVAMAAATRSGSRLRVGSAA